MARVGLTIGAVLLMAAITILPGNRRGVAAQSGPAPAGISHTGPAFRFNKVREGVYHAIGTGALTVVGNSAVIVNDRDVVIVDDHVSPAAAWVLLEEVKQITTKPVSTVINTHFHFDHAHGNQIFDPTVQIIGHEFTRRMLLLGNPTGMPLYKGYRAGLQPQIDQLKQQLAGETDSAKKEMLQRQLQAAENNLASQNELRPTPPNVTLKTELTLYRGDREIQVRFLGRGHTGGDVVVFLPKERVVATGDFLTAGLSNMSDAFLEDWVTSLDALKQLDFDTVLPGHGEAFTDRTKIDYFQAYLRDVWTEVSRLKRDGVSPEEAARRADLTRHKEHFPTIQGPGVPLLAVNRIYELLDAARR
jgi:glyoxylase-like metal-dependent hydrolase (beta-lactamase superfamily II)